jgi:hypothetical protein
MSDRARRSPASFSEEAKGRALIQIKAKAGGCGDVTGEKSARCGFRGAAAERFSDRDNTNGF